MNNELLANYFTDQQMATVLGITVGGLRNKIYREKADDLPSFSKIGRVRLWQKAVVSKWLLKSLDEPTVKSLLALGEKAVAGASFSDEPRKARKTSTKK